MKILVIGGGMAGLTYAVIACKNGYDVTVAESNSRVGKKISVTGNGKCNIGNARVSPACFNGGAIVKRVLDSVPVAEYTRFLNSCGIFLYSDNEGRMYPLSDSAANVVDCLRYQIVKFGGKLLTDATVSGLSKTKEGYTANIRGKYCDFDKVVLACGGRSQASVDVRNLVPSELLTPMVPSLVPVRIKYMDPTLNGLRARARVSLWDGDRLLGGSDGEVQFKEYGLSGICVLDLSALIARREVKRQSGEYRFVLDVAPFLEEWSLEEIVYSRLRAGEKDKLFYGILHNKLAEHVVRRAGKDANSTQIAHTAKNLEFLFDKLLDWSMSQVTAGGISERGVSAETLQMPNGVVAIGEILNVDGVCGGNNLYFAAASAIYTFSRAEREKAFSLS